MKERLVSTDGLQRWIVWFDHLDRVISRTMWRVGMPIMRIAVGTMFVWFGLLKIFGISPAEDLVAATVVILHPDLFVPLLGFWEVAIGICFLSRSLIRIGILLLFLQLPGTFLPLILVPEAVYTAFPYGLTVEGQYIIKNLVIIGAALVIGGTVRGDEEWELAD